MTEVKFIDYEIPAAGLGEENCMPDIGNVEYIHAGYTLTERVSAEDAEFIGKGMIRTMLPYTLQDQYDRDLKPRRFKAAVLENEKLRAVFLPELGGRLWSLYHKGLERELLYVNPIFQPANLALRNAWFSGGVEWNIGIKGHNPLTCSPMFACPIEDEKGNPGLRMYEYERIRGVAYSMDFLLPEGEDILYVRTTIENTADKDCYMYWWSNMAVSETRDVRIVAPCDQALRTHYGEGGYVIDSVDIPCPDNNGIDCTYPRNAACSRDYFFRIGSGRRKWITAPDKDGIGLLQFSTPEMKGRKLFLWGQGQGGRNWNRWLSGGEYPYVEIQAGLARTQYEHFLMKGNSTLSWVEGYTAAVCDPGRIHGEYQQAVSAVEEFLNGKMPPDEQMRQLFSTVRAGEIRQNGSGWGHVENCLRSRCGAPAVSDILCFPASSVGEGEKIWLDFIRTGIMEDRGTDAPPASFYADARLLPLFEEQIRSGNVSAWLYLQYGIVLYACEYVKEAYAAFEKSAELQPNAWAYRNLSMIEKNEFRCPEKSLAFIEKAIRYNCTDRGLMVNCAQVMLHAGVPARWIEVFDRLEEPLSSDSRLRLYKAIALMELGQYARAAEIVNPGFVLCDIKEGEVSLSHIWDDLYRNLVKEQYPGFTEAEQLAVCREKYPLPAHLDFRMDA